MRIFKFRATAAFRLFVCTLLQWTCLAAVNAAVSLEQARTDRNPSFSSAELPATTEGARTASEGQFAGAAFVGASISTAVAGRNTSFVAPSAGSITLNHAAVGTSFNAEEPDLSFGSIITPPSTQVDQTTAAAEGYWIAEPWNIYEISPGTGDPDELVRNTANANNRFYWSVHSQQVYATQPGEIEVVWRRSVPSSDLADGVGYANLGGQHFQLQTNFHLIGPGSAKRPRQIYWTDGGYHAPPVTIGGNQIKSVNIVYSSVFPETVATDEVISLGPEQGGDPSSRTKTLWLSAHNGISQLHARNIEGRVFVEFLGESVSGPNHGDRRVSLGTEIISVTREPAAIPVRTELGERLNPSQEGPVPDLFPVLDLQVSRKDFVYQHPLHGGDLEYYAIHPTDSPNDVLVYWMEEGELGIRWPRRYVRYELAWPTAAVAFSHCVRHGVNTEEEAKQTAVALPLENSPSIVYQDPDGPLARLTGDGKFYTWFKPSDGGTVHRTLLRFHSGAFVHFERVMSWIDESLLVQKTPKFSVATHMTQTVSLKDGDFPYEDLHGTRQIAIAGNYAYVAAESDHALNIFDIRNPREPVLVSVAKGGTSGDFSGMTKPYSVFVHDNVAYVGGAEPNDTLTLIDVSDPRNPRKLHQLRNGQTTDIANGIVHGLRDIVSIHVAAHEGTDGTKKKVAYLAALWSDTVVLLDVTDPRNPRHLHTLSDSDPSVDRLTNPTQVIVRDNTLFVASETSQSVNIYDVSDPGNPSRLSVIHQAHNGFHHIGGVRGIAAEGDFLYIASHISDSLTIADISDLSAPEFKSVIRNVHDGVKLDDASRVFVSNGAAFVVARNDNAVTVVDVRDPMNPRLLSEWVDGRQFDNLGNPQDVVIAGNFAYVTAHHESALTVVDLTPLAAGTVLPGYSDNSIVTSLEEYDATTGGLVWSGSTNGPLAINQVAYVGQRLVAPTGEEGHTGLYRAAAVLYQESGDRPRGDAFSHSAYVDPFKEGFDAANAGAVIPVNVIPGDDRLTALWFRKNRANEDRGFLPVYWPAAIGRYTIQWPTNDAKIVLASNDGSGPLTSLEAKGQIYFQNSKSAGGFNPNEEHALMLGGQAYALRDDLNYSLGNVGSSDFDANKFSSEPYVLVEYTDGDGRPSMSVFAVQREDRSAGIVFDHPVEAGTILQAPMPLPLMEPPTVTRSAGTPPVSLNHEIADSWAIENSTVSATDQSVTLKLRDPFIPLPGQIIEIVDFSSDPVRKEYFLTLEYDLGARTVRGYALTGTVGVELKRHEGDPDVYTCREVRPEDKSLKQGAHVVIEHGNELTAAEITKFDTLSGGTGYHVFFDTSPQLEYDSKELDYVVRNTKALSAGYFDGWVMDLSGPDGQAASSTLGKQFKGFTLQDRKHNIWVYRGPHYPEKNSGRGPKLGMQFYYKTREGFYFPNATQPDVGTVTPYLRRRRADGTIDTNYGGVKQSQSEGKNKGNALPIIYRSVWPSTVPVLQMGETLTTAKRGLPAIRGNRSLEVVYEQSKLTNTISVPTVVLHDPTRSKTYELPSTGLTNIPPSVKTSVHQGKTYFPNLPPHLVKRFYFDPDLGARGALVFKGEFVDAPIGEDYLLVNVLSQEAGSSTLTGDVATLKDLVPAVDTHHRTHWENAIDGLSTRMELFVEQPAKPGTFSPNPSDTVTISATQRAEISDDDVAVDSYALTAIGRGHGYVTLISGNGRAFQPEGEPVSVEVIRVVKDLHRGEVKIVESSNPLSEKITFQQVVDLAGTPSDFDFDWRVAPPVEGGPAAVYTHAHQSLRLAGETWKHLQYPKADETFGNAHNADASRVAEDVRGSVQPVSRFGGFTSSVNAQDPEKLNLSQHGRLDAGNDIVLVQEGGRFLEIPATVQSLTGGGGMIVDPDLESAGDDAEGFVPTRVDEAIVPGQPQSIVFREFNSDAGSEYSSLWLGLNLDASLGAKVYVDGHLVAEANLLTNDTDTATPPGAINAYPKSYRLSSADLAGGTDNHDGTFTHRITAELFTATNAVSGTPMAFDIRIDGFKLTDLVSTPSSPWTTNLQPDRVRASFGGKASVLTLADNYVIMRYRATNVNHVSYDSAGGGWSQWTEPVLAEGWIKRVLGGINPFNQRTGDFFANRVDTDASLLSEAGPRWEGDVALNLAAVQNAGLIQIYETVLKRGRKLSIDAGINYGPANDALLLAAGYISDLYMFIGNDAWADAANPTIGIGTANNTYRELATSLFAFKGQVPSVLEEELALLRGRDDFSQPGVELAPVYNRLYWNYTKGIDSGEVIYALNYDIKNEVDETLDGAIGPADAERMFPQGHGDAYGHYLTSLKGYYSLLLNEKFTWIPRSEAINVLGVPITVDYLDERKFAAAASAVARTGRQIFDLTWRKDYQKGKGAGWSHLAPTRDNSSRKSGQSTRYWGADHWACRTGQGAYLNWVAGNTILPPVDPDPSHEGIQKIDRTTIPELAELPATYEALQRDLDNAEAHLNPLGFSDTSVPFDLNPAGGSDNSSGFATGTSSHFEQVYERAIIALKNAVVAFDDAKDVTRLMRSDNDSLADFRNQVDEQELAFKFRLIELYGTPYPEDIGPPPALYVQGYDGPDLVHYMYVENVAPQLEQSYVNAPREDQVFKIDIQNYPKGYFAEDKSQFTWLVTAPQGDNENLVGFLPGFHENFLIPDEKAGLDVPYEEGRQYVEYQLDSHGFFRKPEHWTGRRASPGKIQTAISKLILAHNAVRQSLSNNAKTKYQLDRMLEVYENAQNIRSRQSLANQGIGALVLADAYLGMKLKNAEDARQKKLRDLQLDRDIMLALIPNNVIGGTADGGDVFADEKAEIDWNFAQSEFALKLEDYEIWLGRLRRAGIPVATAGLESLKSSLAWHQHEREQVFDIDMQFVDVQHDLLLITEAVQRLDEARREYRAAVAEGDRLQVEREVYRKRAAAVIQGYRTRDAAFRVFQNEKLERYKSLFDLAAQYVYLAEQAYDYETGLLGSEQGRGFIERIINSRAVGVVKDGEPQFAGSDTGDPGLSSILAEMKADWDVVKGRLGFNNPDIYRTTVSMRLEKYRIKGDENSDPNWQNVLHAGRVTDLLTDEDVRRYCRGIESTDGGPVPGIVLEFSTLIADGRNLFGLPLVPGDHAYSSSSFANKIYSVGVALEGYEGMDDPTANTSTIDFGTGGTRDPTLSEIFESDKALAATPYVYLIPVGKDYMLVPPLGNASGTRAWDVADVTIPLPFDIGGSGLSNERRWQTADSLSEPIFGLRKHQAFRPVSSASIFYNNNARLFPSIYSNTRLIGRSVWNSRWKLVIPGRTLLADPNDGLDRFIKTVKDIKLNFETYSYSGN